LDGNTAIFFATMGGNKEIIKYLIDKGADLNIKNKTEHSVIEYAQEKDIKQILLAALEKNKKQTHKKYKK